MPRTGKGKVAPGETYGDRAPLEEMMQSAPMPGGVDPQVALQSAQQMPPPPNGGLLRGPSTRPNEPITHGMAIGAGGGREVLRGTSTRPPNDRLNEQIKLAAELSGNPRLIQMARRTHRKPKPSGSGLQQPLR